MKKIILSKRFLHGVLLTLAFCLLPVLPAFAQGDIVDRLDKALGVTLPSEYKSKVKTFVQSSRVFKDKDACALTEQFIKDEMKKDWGISKQSQLLFIWTALNEKINGEYLYDGSDGNESRLEEFGSIMNTYDECGKRYETAFRARMKEISAEARKQSAEARKQSAEARQQSAEARKQSAEARKQSAEARQQSINALNNALESVISFYNSYTISPAPERLASFKPKVKELISRCKDLHINYKEKLSPEILKFYGIE